MKCPRLTLYVSNCTLNSASGGRAWPGLKARALAWLERARAYLNLRPGPDGGLGLGLAWFGPEPGPGCETGSNIYVIEKILGSR
jgi:hypothetical protein